MENTAICWDTLVTKAISRQEHPANKTGVNSPQRLIRSDYRFFAESLYDYYLLGYTVADGCIIRYPERHTYQVAWSSIDIDMLERIKERFGGHGNILKQKKYKENHSQVYKYAISGKDLVSDFMAYGILPRKTYHPQVPSNLTSEQFIAFLGGLIDGDGCWWIAKRKNTSPALHQSIRSYDKSFLEEIMNRLKEEFNLIGCIHTDNSSPRLVYSTRPALILYEMLPLSFMSNRKQEKVEEFISMRGGWDQLKKKCKNCGESFIKYRHNQMYCSRCYDANR